MYELPSDYATPTWPSRVGAVAGMLLGAILLVAAWGKALDPLAFAEQIRTEGLDLVLSAESVALVALGVEVALGVALLLGIRRLWTLLPTVALVALFLFLTGRSYWRFSQGLLDATETCNCFGNLLDRTPSEAFWQDLLMLVPLTALAFIGRQRGPGGWPRKRILAVAVALVGAVMFAWYAPTLPLDDLATRLKPGVIISDICAGSEGENRICLDVLVPELEDGQYLVIMAALDDEDFLGAVDRLSDQAALGTEPRILMLTTASAEELHAFEWQWAPGFEIREAPAALLRPLYRRLPRSFAVSDGKVTETFSGLPPV